jgi:catechol 2,3-dioxygenase-like lactoylglutathione lyase family enzyme
MDGLEYLPSRREFLEWTAASGAVALARRLPAMENNPADPRILRLELLTAAPLKRMKDFYHRLLGFEVLDDRPERLTIAAGLSQITFFTAKPEDGKPFYHFAFNIPENKILAARTWQRERTSLLPISARLRHPAYPADVVDYRHWNAHSIFFFDPAGNVVEYIARHDLQNGAQGAFDSKDILYASEIGLIVDDVPGVASNLKELLGIGQYRGGSDQFTALGDEHGLLLIMKRGRVVSFDAEEKKAVSVFRTAASVRGAEKATHHIAGFPYEVVVEG